MQQCIVAEMETRKKGFAGRLSWSVGGHVERVTQGGRREAAWWIRFVLWQQAIITITSPTQQSFGVENRNTTDKTVTAKGPAGQWPPLLCFDTLRDTTLRSWHDPLLRFAAIWTVRRGRAGCRGR